MARTGPRPPADAVSVGSRRRSTALLPSSEANTGRQALQVRNASEATPKAADKTVLVIASNVSVFRRIKGRGSTKSVARPSSLLQVRS